MSPAHKIEEISIRYNNAFLNNIMNQIRNLTAVQKKSYAEQVGRKLGVASMETKRGSKSLMPEKFNGEGIIDVLGRQRSTTKLEAAIRLLWGRCILVDRGAGKDNVSGSQKYDKNIKTSGGGIHMEGKPCK